MLCFDRLDFAKCLAVLLLLHKSGILVISITSTEFTQVLICTTSIEALYTSKANDYEVVLSYRVGCDSGIEALYTSKANDYEVVLSYRVGCDSIPVRMPDSQSREPGFKSHCGRFEPLASLITPRWQ